MNDQERMMYYLLGRLHKIVSKIGQKVVNVARSIYYQQYLLKFGERDDDIYIATYPKSGTTRMQMLVYQLLTDGSMDFEHIYDVSPWIRNEALLKKEPRELPSPRIIKSHERYAQFSKSMKGRIIFVMRDGKDVAASMFHQQRNYNKPNLEFATFFKHNYVKPDKMNYFTFMKAWLRNSKKLPILYIRFEDMIADFDAVVYKVAAFLQVEVPPDALPRIRERCSFDFMKAHEAKFGEQPPKKKERIYNQFIRKGKAGEGQALFTPSQHQQYEERFAKHLKQFGFYE
ncbi:MAG: sulfotransferase domain-containing protein [Bacteroidota bacterium]